MSGKSCFLSELIQHQKDMFDRGSDRVVYCYAEWQPGFDGVRRTCKHIESFRQLDAVLENEDFFDGIRSALIIIDDSTPSG